VKIAHTAALQAAALVLQGQNWHKVRQGQLVHALKLLSFTEVPDELIADWHQAGQRLVRRAMIPLNVPLGSVANSDRSLRVAQKGKFVAV
jgi:hypothetical protein